jgi:hypothetical protein
VARINTVKLQRITGSMTISSIFWMESPIRSITANPPRKNSKKMTRNTNNKREILNRRWKTCKRRIWKVRESRERKMKLVSMKNTTKCLTISMK